MSTASDLIERMERENGCRVDSNDFKNDAILGLMGAMSREMGLTKFKPEDDFAVGVLIQHRSSPQYKQQQESLRLFCDMVTGGMSPEAAHILMK